MSVGALTAVGVKGVWPTSIGLYGLLYMWFYHEPAPVIDTVLTTTKYDVRYHAVSFAGLSADKERLIAHHVL